MDNKQLASVLAVSLILNAGFVLLLWFVLTDWFEAVEFYESEAQRRAYEAATNTRINPDPPPPPSSP